MDTYEVIVLEVRNTTSEAIRSARIFPGPSDNTPDSPIVYMVHSRGCYSDELFGLIKQGRELMGCTHTRLMEISVNNHGPGGWHISGQPLLVSGPDEGEDCQWPLRHSGRSPLDSRTGYDRFGPYETGIPMEEQTVITIDELGAKARLVFILHLIHQ